MDELPTAEQISELLKRVGATHETGRTIFCYQEFADFVEQNKVDGENPTKCIIIQGD